MRVLIYSSHHPRNFGIAIGPIIFIIAIIAIIAAAIASSSGGFATSTNTEKYKIQAQALINFGNNVQNAVTFLLGNGCADTQLNFYSALYTYGYSQAGQNPNAPSDHSCDVFGAVTGVDATTFPGSYGYNNITVNNIYPALLNIPGVGIPGQALSLIISGVDGATCRTFNDLVNIPRVDFFNNPQGTTGPYPPQSPGYAGVSPWYYNYTTYAAYFAGLPSAFSQSIFSGAWMFCAENGFPSNYLTSNQSIIYIVLYLHGG